MVDEKKFCADLYYRLHVYPLVFLPCGIDVRISLCSRATSSKSTRTAWGATLIHFPLRRWMPHRLRLPGESPNCSHVGGSSARHSPPDAASAGTSAGKE
jgi:hypothetical protein